MKTKITVLLFFAFGYALSQVGINTETPLSMLDINGNLSVKHLTIPENGSDTGLQLIDDGVYISINPQVQDQEFRLPNAANVPGRIYIIRNISNTLTARLTTAGGLLFKRNFTNDGRTELFMFDGNLKTIITYSDGVSWNTFNDF